MSKSAKGDSVLFSECTEEFVPIVITSLFRLKGSQLFRETSVPVNNFSSFLMNSEQQRYLKYLFVAHPLCNCHLNRFSFSFPTQNKSEVRKTRTDGTYRSKRSSESSERLIIRLSAKIINLYQKRIVN